MPSVSESQQIIGNRFLYIWTENKYQKDLNKITSAIYHRLKNTDFSGISEVTLYSNDYEEQNKNWSMIKMLSKWLVSDAPGNITKVWLVFPVVGHSFVPSDNLWSLGKTDLKEMQSNKSRKLLRDFRKFVTVILLRDIPILNWKHYLEVTLKDTGSWHFQFQKPKVTEMDKGKTGKSANVTDAPFYDNI